MKRVTNSQKEMRLNKKQETAKKRKRRRRRKTKRIKTKFPNRRPCQSVKKSLKRSYLQKLKLIRDLDVLEGGLILSKSNSLIISSKLTLQMKFASIRNLE